MKTADIVSCALVTLFGLTLLFVIIPDWGPVESGPGFGLAATAMPNVAAATATALAAKIQNTAGSSPAKLSESENSSDCSVRAAI